MTHPTNDLVSQWLEALRSGAYRQTRGALHAVCTDGDRYCCLGVLRVVAGQNGVLIGRASHSDHLDTEDARHAALLSYEDQRRLSRMNDDKGSTFAEIADWLEANIYRGYGFAKFRAATLTALDRLGDKP